MYEYPKQTSTPFEDPELIARADGDPLLLNRLVGLRIAEEVLASDPGNSGFQRTVQDMREAVEAYEQGRHTQ